MSTENLSVFGSRVKHARKAQRLTRKEVADYVGLSSSAVVAWESGKNLANDEVFPKLAEILKVSVGWLRGDSENRHPTSGVFIPLDTRNIGRLEGLAASRNKSLPEFLEECIARSVVQMPKDSDKVSSDQVPPDSVEEAFSILVQKGAKESLPKPLTGEPNDEASEQTRT